MKEYLGKIGDPETERELALTLARHLFGEDQELLAFCIQNADIFDILVKRIRIEQLKFLNYYASVFADDDLNAFIEQKEREWEI